MSTDPVTCARRGPHPVGLQHFEIDDPDEPGRRLPIDVWYPADVADAGGSGLEPAGHAAELSWWRARAGYGQLTVISKSSVAPSKPSTMK